MPRLQWDQVDFEAGVDRGVFYPKNSPGEVWNGLISVEDAPESLSERSTYLDGTKLASRRREAPYSAKVSCYANPVSFFDTIAQRRSQGFGFSYRATDKIHIVYNARAAASGMNYQYNDPGLYSWLLSTIPVPLPEGGATSHLIVDPGLAYPSAVSSLEDILYGTDTTEARLPTPSEVLDVFEINSILRVVDNGDGSFTVTGPDDAITMVDSTTFQITWPSAVFIDSITYTIHSL